MDFNSEQEKFWAEDFGDDYVERNKDPRSIANRTAVFSKILSRTRGVSSVFEFGTNIGQNLKAIRDLLPSCKFGGIEINAKACKEAETIPNAVIHQGSILDFNSEELGQYDLTLTAGVLIHINPEMLEDVYSRLYECSRKYILINEYYNPSPTEVNYRGHSERLFKRDFAGELMDRYNDLKLVDYGFQYHRDNNFPSDDSTWFLMVKES